MASEYDVVHVVRCKDCIHCEDGKCEMCEYYVVKPCEFCWWGQTASGRESLELEAIPIEWIKKFAANDDMAGSIYRMIEEWRNNDGEKN